ncbi:DNA polymerase III subunit delta' [Moellerella wisconsensis]|nr:DNA polymerase III subunit delta' [Moellerella wisconsensis]
MTTRLYWLMGLLTDAMKYQQGAAEFCSNQDQLPLIAQLANIQAPSQLFGCL